MCSLILKHDYYIVIINPRLHKKHWTNLKTILKVAEVKYVLYIDYEIDDMELHSVSKDEFKSYNYNPN